MNNVLYLSTICLLKLLEVLLHLKVNCLVRMIIGLASIVVPPTVPLEQYLLDHENDLHMHERNEIDKIFFEQRTLLKHNLPIETLGGPPPPKGDPMFELKQLLDTLKYAYLDEKKIYHVIITTNLSEHEEERLSEQRPLLKHNLPIETPGGPPPPKGDPVFELKQLPDTLKYAYIDEKKIYLVIISANLSEHEEERLLKVM